MKVTLRNVTKKFGDKIAVNNVDMDFDDGKLISILGSSGCGKSTTLNLIAGIEKHTTGKIFYDNKDVSEIKTENRNIGMIFQNYALYPHMTVFDNIAFPLKIQKYKKSEIKDMVEEVCTLVKISHLLNHKPSELSGGEQQRVAIARAIVKKPDLLLMDEPFSNLDKKLRNETRMEIRNLQKQLNITTIFVTHDQEEAMSISDKIILMSNGKVVQSGTPSDIYFNPVNLESAKFFGDGNLNFYKARITDGMLSIRSLRTNYHLNLKDDEYYIAFRPEDIIVVNEDELIELRVDSYQIVGRSILVYGQNNDFNVEFYIDKNDIENIHETYKIQIPKDRIMIFNIQDGSRVYEKTHV